MRACAEDARLAFRNREVAAPLKRYTNVTLRALQGAFRNREVAAPLKPAHGVRLARAPWPFRNREVAAPLKRLARRNDCAGGRRPSATVRLRPH